MNDPSNLAIATAMLGIACFACFTWGTLRHFAWRANGAPGAWVISLLSWAGLGVFLRGLVSCPMASTWWVAWLLFVLSVALWAWAIAQTRPTPPTLAFTSDEPSFLFATGPYRWVRHPFYTSYLLYWLGTALTSRTILGIIPIVVMGILYVVAARYEEGKFKRSTLSLRYQAYAERTGMFLPRLGLNLPG